MQKNSERLAITKNKIIQRQGRLLSFSGHRYGYFGAVLCLPQSLFRANKSAGPSII